MEIFHDGTSEYGISGLLTEYIQRNKRNKSSKINSDNGLLKLINYYIFITNYYQLLFSSRHRPRLHVIKKPGKSLL